MAYTNRRQFLRSEVARALDGIDGMPITEVKISGTARPAGAFRCGSQDFTKGPKQEPGDSRASRVELGTMIVLLQIDLGELPPPPSDDTPDTALDEAVGVAEDALEGKLEAYTVPLPWTHPSGREQVEIHTIERAHLIPSLVREASRGELVVPLVVTFRKTRKRS